VSGIEVDFTLRWEDTDLSAAEALGRSADLMEEVRRPWDLEGSWSLRTDEIVITWEDTLVPLITAVCLEPVPRLVQEGHAVASRTSEYGYLRFDAEGSWIRLGGDDLPSGRVPARAFVEAQLGCAGRLISLLLAIGQDGFDVRALKEDRRSAALALASWPVAPASEAWGPIPEAAPRREAEGPIWLDGTDRLRIRCGSERFELPGPAHEWLARLESVRPRLEQGEHVVIPFGGRYGYLRLDGEGEAIRLSGDGLADLRVPRASLLAALRALPSA
jgi:hypothetical protein